MYCVANFCGFGDGGAGINQNSNQGSLFIVKLERKELWSAICFKIMTRHTCGFVAMLDSN